MGRSGWWVTPVLTLVFIVILVLAITPVLTSDALPGYLLMRESRASFDRPAFEGLKEAIGFTRAEHLSGNTFSGTVEEFIAKCESGFGCIMRWKASDGFEGLYLYNTDWDQGYLWPLPAGRPR